jgi:predicted Ser/Thr protein kinase
MPKQVLKWKSFERDMRHYYMQRAGIDWPSLLDIPRSSSPLTLERLCSDNTVQFFVSQDLLYDVRDLFNETTHRKVRMDRVPGDACLVDNRDMLAWDFTADGTVRLLLPMQMKKPLELVEEDLREAYNAGHSGTRSRVLVETMTRYMEFNKLEYGYMTTYCQSYACFLDSDGSLHVSRPFAHDETKTTLMKVVYYLLALAVGSDGYKGPELAKVVDPRPHRKVTRSMTASGYIIDAVIVTVCLRSRPENRVERGRVGQQRVVLKRANNKVARCRLQTELRIYRQLQHLQGSVVPRVLGSGRDYLITEDCGESLIWYTGVYNALKPKVRRAIQTMHAAKVYHGDLASRNVLVQGERVTIIDFENSAVVDDPDILLGELKCFFEEEYPRETWMRLYSKPKRLYRSYYLRHRR